MRTIVAPQYGPPEVLQHRDAPEPKPAAGEILIAIRATSVTVADVRIRAFRVPKALRIPARLALGLRRPRNPVLGAEIAGVVEAVGTGTNRFSVGDEVFAACLSRFGGYAEKICLKETGPVSLKPKNLGFEESAVLPVGGTTALHYLRRMGVGRGSRLLVYGASGSVGSYAVQIARHLGAEVTGVCSAGNGQKALALGAAQVWDYAQPLPEGRSGFDAVLDAVDKAPFAFCLSHLKPGGVYANATDPLPSWAMLRARFRVGGKRIRLVLGEGNAKAAEDMETLRRLSEAGEVRPLMDKTYPFEEIVAAHRYVDGGHKAGNVAVTLSRGIS